MIYSDLQISRAIFLQAAKSEIKKCCLGWLVGWFKGIKLFGVI